LFANPNCPFSAGITVRFEPARLSVFRKNPCPFSTGINVRFAQELLSAFSKNRCPFCAGFCTHQNQFEKVQQHDDKILQVEDVIKELLEHIKTKDELHWKGLIGD